MTHEERVSIARELADAILETHGDAVLAVFITSSTAKGLDREHSDLELTTVVRDGVDIEEKSYVYRGILIEIEYAHASRLLEAARHLNHRRQWPVEADGFRSRIVLVDREGWLRQLEAAVAESDRAELSPALHLAATGLIEGRDKIRNHQAASDALNIRVQAFWLGYEAASTVLLLNRRYMTTTSSLFRQAFECPIQPRDFRRRIERLVGVVPATADELVETVEALTGELLTIVRARGVSVESDVLMV